MGSETAFQPMRYTSFALYMDCLPVTKARSNVIGQNSLNTSGTVTRNLVLLPTVSAYICRYVFTEISSDMTINFSDNPRDF